MNNSDKNIVTEIITKVIRKYHVYTPLSNQF